MFSTPVSLLERLRKPNESSAWDRFVELYSPLLYHWAKRSGLQESDAADLVQELFLLLFRKLPEFKYDASRSFHAWLKTLFLNQHRTRQRGHHAMLLDGAIPDTAAPIDDVEGAEYRRYVVQQGLRLIEREFSPLQCEAFRAHVLAERSAEDVAQELGLRPGTVYSIKSKILSRLRQELRDFLK